MHLASKAGGERTVAAEDFFVGVMQTAAGPEELVTAVSLPPQPEGARTAYVKYAIRPLDFAIVSVAVRLVPAADGTIADARIGLAGAANHTLRATEAERVLVGERPSAELLERAGQAAARAGRPAGGRRRHAGLQAARGRRLHGAGARPGARVEEAAWARSTSTRTSARASGSGSAAPTTR